MEPIRLQKFFTDCGLLSRRAAEEEIRAGRVRVNNEPAFVGQKIDPAHDVVLYRGRRVQPSHKEHLTVMLYKPAGYVTTLSDEKGRRTVKDLVAGCGRRLYPVGRLDLNSEGLLLLTDDGALAEHLTHPRHETPKHYLVTVTGTVSKSKLDRLGRPFQLDGYTTKSAVVTVKESTPTATTLAFTLFEGRNRQIRRMCEQVDLRIQRLLRTAIGELTLGDLQKGKWRALTDAEIAYLKGSETI